MLAIDEVIVVEGKYDKNKLSRIVDATILTTEGFGIFSDKDKLDLLRRIAETRGIIVMTDSDGAGFLIRNFLKSTLGKENVRHAYIPDIEGKEKRKSSPSKEGKLGVEGINDELLLQALMKAGASQSTQRREPISKADMYVCGLSGTRGADERRKELKKRLALPEKLSSNALLDVLNSLMTREEFLSMFSA